MKYFAQILIFILLLIGLTNQEIHRASSRNVQSRGLRRNQRESIKFFDHELSTWIYSLLSSALIGLTGILPLIVIPLDYGRKLQNKASADKLQVLLSFAVGSLLGDVFFHLLPEAFAHVPNEYSGKRYLRKIGLWLLVGLLGFWFIEKLFPEKETDDKEKAVNNEKLNDNDFLSRHSGNIIQKISSECKNDSSKTTLSCLPNFINIFKTTIKSASKLPSNVTNLEDDSHIKTVGWLNLMANVIDNFTHGLAVAGSFTISTKVGLITTIAILLHEIPHEIGDFAILLKSGFDRWRAARAQILTATGGMFGAIVALCSESTGKAGDKIAWVLPFTSGGFLYIALISIVPDMLNETDSRKSFHQICGLFTGIAVMYSVTVLFD